MEKRERVIKMEALKLIAASAATVICLSMNVQAGISDFYITDASGLVYEVDGGTLEATEVIQLENASSIHEIMYMGDNQLMYNVFGLLSVTDLVTGVTQDVFNVRDHLGPGIHDANGLAMTDSGDIYLSVRSQDPQSSSDYGALINIENQSFTALAEFSQREFYLDNHQVEENLFLSADWLGGTIDMVNTSTGDILSEMSFGFDPVSFFEADGAVYVIAKEGGLYTFDYLAGTVDYLGDVSGAGTSIIGATVPAPGSLAFLGFAGIAAARRRR